MKDVKFAFYSKYTLLTVLLFVVLFSLRGSCTELEICAGGFPMKWLFKENNNVLVSYPSILLNLLIYYIISAILLLGMRKYANYKHKVKLT